MAGWVSNSVQYNNRNFSDTYVFLLYILVVVGIMILIHSAMLNGKRWHKIRIQTDAAAVSVALAGLFGFIALRFSNDSTAHAVLFDLFCCGIFRVIVQVCDNYMFYYRYITVVRVSANINILVQLYIWMALVFPWWIVFTFCPFFVDMNTPSMRDYTRVAFAVYTFGNSAFNFVLALEFSRILNINFSQASNQVLAALSGGDAARSHASLLRYKMLVIKSLGHCLSSSAAAFLSTNYDVLGGPIYLLVVLCGMHLWFNFSIEDVLCPMQQFLTVLPAQTGSNDLPLRPTRRDRIILQQGRYSNSGDPGSRSIASWEPTFLGSRKSGGSRVDASSAPVTILGGFAMVMPRNRGSSQGPVDDSVSGAGNNTGSGVNASGILSVHSRTIGRGVLPRGGPSGT